MTMAMQVRSLLRQARSDGVLLGYLALLAAVHVPYFLPMLSEDQLYNYSWIVASLFLLPSLSFLLWPFEAGKMPVYERSFWKILSIAFMFWWAGGLLNWLLPEEAWTIPVSIAANSIYLGYYICWMWAISLIYQRERRENLPEPENWLHVSAIIVLAFWLFAYFILIPSQFMPNAYATWVPSLLFYAGLDLALALLFLRLALISESRRWATLFGLIAIASFVYCLLDALESATVIYSLAWAEDVTGSVIWSVPYALVALFARARTYSFKDDSTVIWRRKRSSRAGSEYSNPILLMSFLPPVVHLTVSQFDLVSEATHQVQESVVLGSLIVFWLLAIFENRHIRRVTRAARRKQEELAQVQLQQQVAEETRKAKARFLANISHEIRTPLSGVLGMTELQLLDESNPDKRRRAELVRDSAKSLTKIIDSILEYSSIESGEMLMHHEPFVLDSAVGGVCELFESIAAKKGLTLSLEIEAGTPNQLIGDEARLLQLITILIANAIKFSEQGGISVRLSAEQPDEQTATIRCQVVDTGTGIEESEVAALFLPFSQGDESASRKYGGSGLGLAIAKQIVESQCGTISARNNPEGGSTFWFEVPFAIDKKVFDQPLASVPHVKRMSYRVLLAEDERTCQLVTTKQLECLGYEVDVVPNGREAVKAVARDRYDAVLMDCRMPILDGLEATRQIRAMEPPRNAVPVIALTSLALEANRVNCRHAGMNDFLLKPATLDDFRRVLAKWLPEHAAGEQLNIPLTGTT